MSNYKCKYVTYNLAICSENNIILVEGACNHVKQLCYYFSRLIDEQCYKYIYWLYITREKNPFMGRDTHMPTRMNVAYVCARVWISNPQLSIGHLSCYLDKLQ